ncbi:MAG: hypothetical protein HY234_15365 [Acidobacteria bacterium]|nr:hypothetical protein [Acidobacteriota bacterium]
MNLHQAEFNLSPELTRLFSVFVLLGVAVMLVGLGMAPERVWPSLLLVSYFVLGMGLAAVVFIALQYVTNGAWGVAIRRVPEAMTVFILAGALGLAVVFLAHRSLYSWTAAAHDAGNTAAWFKRFWLTWPFFLARAVVYLLVWIAFARAIARNSQLQDRDGDVAYTHRNARLSALFLVVFGITLWLASYDWLMSLEPEWFSTIFGMYSFSGLFASGIAAIIIFAVALQKLGPLEGILREDHLHDLGKLLFAFSTFWAYIWFCQYMLIWYTDIPEETGYFVKRMQGTWRPLFLLNFMLNWTVPFLALLPRATKRTPSLLVKVAVIVLLGRWLDLYLIILPPFMGHKPSFGAWEFGLMLGAIGASALLFFRALRRAAPVPMRDPWLSDSLHHHQ